MLTIVLPPVGDETMSVVLKLEHSLVSLSKWESAYEKPFFGKDEKTVDETYAYFIDMVVEGRVPDDFKKRLTADHINQINAYINSKRSATWFKEEPKRRGAEEAITSELIYYWMIAFNIPPDYQNWHLNRLLTLVKICGIKQAPPKKMDKVSQHEMMKRLNEQRKQALQTTG